MTTEPAFLSPLSDDPRRSPDPPPLPSWLAPALTRQEIAEMRRAEEVRAFEAAFDRILERVSSGTSVKHAIEDDFHDHDYGRYLRWIHKDPDRKARYYEAQEIGAEVMSHEIVEIADGLGDIIEDHQRSRLRIEVRQFLIKTWNRKRFGDVKQNDVTVTVNLNDAMSAAEKRLLSSRDVVDVEMREIDGD